jgi:Fe-S oxidoreductase
MLPGLANASLDFRPLRLLMQRALGISAKRSLPHYARERFDVWFSEHHEEPWHRAPADAASASGRSHKKRVVLWDDTFVRYNEPHIGIAAVAVLERLGFEVSLVNGRKCCGRPAFSQGNLDLAAKLARHNISQLSILTSQLSAAPILFLEPSCYSMFVEDYRELGIAGAADAAKRCFLFEKFLDEQMAQGAVTNGVFKSEPGNIAIHAHCHAKSLLHPGFMARVIERIPQKKATVLDTGCCGMAGAFGALEEKYDLSLQVAADLVGKIAQQPNGTQIVASGTSCRHQISDLTDIHPKHIAEVMAQALV